MRRKISELLNLQLFADGGDGGASAGESAEGSAQPGADIPSFIPEKAKNIYAKAAERKKAKAEPTTGSDEVPTEPKETIAEAKVETPAHIPFSELIKSDEYKDEHQAYMQKTIGDRLKKYNGIEDENSKMRDVLGLVASKYGLDPTAEDFMDAISKRIEDDDSYYEQYALDHDMSTEEAKKVVSLERKVEKMNQEKQAREAERFENEQKAQAIAKYQHLLSNAEQTKAEFPNFDLETEMKDPRFVRLCQLNNDDTTAAYLAIHHREVISQRVQMATQQVREQVAASVASNQSRPVENGMASQSASVQQMNFRGMSLDQVRAQAEVFRRQRAKQ